MQLIGFNFTKVSATRESNIEKFSMNTNIEFLDLEKEKVTLLKDNEAIKLTFHFSVVYTSLEEKEKKQGEIILDGHIVLAVSDEEEKELSKSWKKKQIPPNIQIPLYNLILKKCSPKAIYLADELSLHSPVPLPKITSTKKDN